MVYSDHTQVTTARDSSNLRYYYRTYDDQTVRMVDLKRFDLNAKEIKHLSTKSQQPVVEMSDQAK